MTSGGRRVTVTFVTAPACHLCDRGREVLAELAMTYPVDIREVDLTAPVGVRALVDSRAPFPPVVLIDGRPIAHGRLSARHLARQFDRLTAPVTGG